MSTIIHPQNQPLLRHHFPPKPPPPPPHPSSLSLSSQTQIHLRHLLSSSSLSRRTLSKPPIVNDINSLPSLLHLSVQYSEADLEKAVHACSLKFQEDTHLGDVVALCESMSVRDVITWTEMITAYTEFGLVDLAMEVFDKMPVKNCISYNALMAGFCRNGEGLKAVKLFIEMVEEGLELTDFTLSSVINACALVMDVKTSEQIQGMGDAEKMFHMWPFEQDSSVVCTSMLCGYARNGQADDAISFLRCQLEGRMDMDEVTLTSVLDVEL
ncbi:hypothetical protein CRYUN_Cryun16bG0108600 [Craigia yunnanensis]